MQSFRDLQKKHKENNEVFIYNFKGEIEARTICFSNIENSPLVFSNFFNIESEEVEHLQELANFLANRVVQVGPTTDGNFIVLFIDFNAPPPPKCKTIIEALKGFIDMRLKTVTGTATMSADGHITGVINDNKNRNWDIAIPDPEN